MVKHAEIMNMREEEIGKLIHHFSKQTDESENPKIVTIGGYALDLPEEIVIMYNGVIISFAS